MGNAVATIVVARWEGALDENQLRASLAAKGTELAAMPVEADSD
jgi:aerobic C4-dicarboxylate transport protein